MTSEDKKSIVVEEVELTKEDFPVLYRWAEHSPEWLAENLRANAKAFKCPVHTAAANLESDLAHAEASAAYVGEEE